MHTNIISVFLSNKNCMFSFHDTAVVPACTNDIVQVPMRFEHQLIPGMGYCHAILSMNSSGRGDIGKRTVIAYRCILNQYY